MTRTAIAIQEAATQSREDEREFTTGWDANQPRISEDAWLLTETGDDENDTRSDWDDEWGHDDEALYAADEDFFEAVDTFIGNRRSVAYLEN